MRRLLGVVIGGVLLAGCGGTAGDAASRTSTAPGPSASLPTPARSGRGGLELRVGATDQHGMPLIAVGIPMTAVPTGTPTVPRPLAKATTMPRPRVAPCLGRASNTDPPSAEWLSKFAAYRCPTDGAAPVEDDPAEYLITCDSAGEKYLLEPAAWAGSVTSAIAGVPPGQPAWVVNVSLPDDGAAVFAHLSRELFASGGRLALVVAGQVISAPGFDGVITDGELQIAGAFDTTGAHALADRIAGR